MRRWLFALASFFAPALASAHEVYVLDAKEVAYGMATPPFNEFAVAFANFDAFAFWGFVVLISIVTVFLISIIRPLERALDPALAKLRRFAAPISRITLGIAFLAGAYYGATYGPELPIYASFGTLAYAVRLLLAAMGLALIVGCFVRPVALIALALYGYAFYLHGVYMLTYANYLGEIALLLILGMHHGAFPHGRKVAKLAKKLAPYSFAILRVCFGISLFFASFYAKILHNYLTLQVVELPLGHAHSLAYVFGFEPHFLVMGAALIELLAASLFILGVEIRFASLFLLFWLTLSLFYFGENVWPHIILIGIPIAFICYGYDKYSLEGWLMKKGGREPVL